VISTARAGLEELFISHADAVSTMELKEIPVTLSYLKIKPGGDLP
jgi:hypothetical protein